MQMTTCGFITTKISVIQFVVSHHYSMTRVSLGKHMDFVRKAPSPGESLNVLSLRAAPGCPQRGGWCRPPGSPNFLK